MNLNRYHDTKLFRIYYIEKGIPADASIKPTTLRYCDTGFTTFPFVIYFIASLNNSTSHSKFLFLLKLPWWNFWLAGTPDDHKVIKKKWTIEIKCSFSFNSPSYNFLTKSFVIEHSIINTDIIKIPIHPCYTKIFESHSTKIF